MCQSFHSVHSAVFVQNFIALPLFFFFVESFSLFSIHFSFDMTLLKQHKSTRSTKVIVYHEFERIHNRPIVLLHRYLKKKLCKHHKTSNFHPNDNIINQQNPQYETRNNEKKNMTSTTCRPYKHNINHSKVSQSCDLCFRVSLDNNVSELEQTKRVTVFPDILIGLAFKSFPRQNQIQQSIPLTLCHDFMTSHKSLPVKLAMENFSRNQCPIQWKTPN